MHQPLSGVQELQEEAEIRHRDKRKALMKLQKVRQPVRQVQTELRVRQAWGVAAVGAQSMLLLRVSVHKSRCGCFVCCISLEAVAGCAVLSCAVAPGFCCKQAHALSFCVRIAPCCRGKASNNLLRDVVSV